jgi:8-amino-7-oxononanoate synthase
VSRSPSRIWAIEALESIRERGLYRSMEPLASPQGPEVQVGDEQLLNFSSNDYLGLANDGSIRAAFVEGVTRWGVGSGASRLVVGDSEAHHSLERELASLKRAERVLLFNSGYAANSGVLPVLASAEDAIFSDSLNHASLIDGCRLSRARLEIYPHLDLESLERRLAASSARRKWVCTESVFSMDGDVAPLREIVSLCERYGAGLYVDEAHATGVFGAGGSGLCEALGVEGQVDVRMGTLGKALGVFGAHVAVSGEVAEWLVNRARSFIFATALPPAICVAAEAAVRRARSPHGDGLRVTLWRHIHRFAAGLRELGQVAEPRSPIFPVILGSPERTLQASEALRRDGIWVTAIRPPTVPEGTSRLRFCLSAAHTEAQIDQALSSLKRVLGDAAAGTW